MSRWIGRGNAEPRVVSLTRPGIELVAGVIVQRPMAASGPIGAIPRSVSLPQVITLGGGTRRM